MADMAKSNFGAASARIASHEGNSMPVHPTWLRLIDFCAKLDHGEIEKLKIQDGLPMIAEVTTRKVKFSP
jgi:hypothetical protein